MDKKINTVSFANRIKIAKFLESVIEPLGEGQCRYRIGWDDASVAESMDFECNNHNVASVRKELYGRLYVTSSDNTQEVIAELARQITELSARVDALEGRS